MSPDQYRELSPRILGRNPARWELDAAWNALEKYPADVIAGLLTRMTDTPTVHAIAQAAARQLDVDAARTRALNPTRCEHGHHDLPYDPCPQCNVGRAERAHRGASKVRQALHRPAEADPDGTSDRADIATPVEATAGGAG